MKLSEESGKITIRHVPLVKWIAGGILTIVFGILVCWLIYRSFVYSFQNFSEFIDLLFIIAIFVIALFEIKMIRAPLIVLTIDAKTQSIEIVKQRFYGKKTQRFYFHQITKFRSLKSKTNFSEKYFLALVLTSLKTMKFEIPITGDKRETMKFTRKLNKFIKSNKISI